jgi:hypothetical protein
VLNYNLINKWSKNINKVEIVSIVERLTLEIDKGIDQGIIIIKVLTPEADQVIDQSSIIIEEDSIRGHPPMLFLMAPSFINQRIIL